MARKKGSKQNKRRISEMEDLLDNNIKAMKEGPKRKKWTLHDLKSVQPLTETQKQLFTEFFQDQHICAHGSAGTGKTFLALYLAFSQILSKDTPQDKVIIVRSAVATRDIGFMPGDLDEKMSFYETPYKDILSELFKRPSTYDDMKSVGMIQFMPTSFIRGLTWDNAIVVVDEGQNMTFHEINSIMTRLGETTRVIFTGDMPQTDLRKNKQDVSGMQDFLKIISKMDEFESVHFSTKDIVRSQFVKSWIVASEEVG